MAHSITATGTLVNINPAVINEQLLAGPAKKQRSMGSHHSAAAETDVWLTPPAILKALGPFDLDPCAAPDPRRWDTAAVNWTKVDDGSQPPMVRACMV